MVQSYEEKKARIKERYHTVPGVKEATISRNNSWRENNREEYLEKGREYQHRPEVKDRMQRQNLLYRQRPENKQRKNEQARNRRRTDVIFRLADNCRKRVSTYVTRNSREQSSLELLGCTVSALKAHLEAQFTKDMSWDTYGRHGWHIDHIKPIASFDLSIPEQVQECFHYTNLQPLWAEENLRKGCSMQDSQRLP